MKTEKVIHSGRKDEDNRQWRVILTRSRFEKKVASQLEGCGIECFLPTRIENRVWSDRKKRVEMPVFPGFLFVRLHSQEVREMYEIYGFAKFLTIGNQMDSIADREIEAMKALFQTDYEIKTANFSAGAPVMITKGRLTGLRGTLAGKQENGKVLVNIAIFNNCFQTLLNESDLLHIEEENLLVAS